MILCDSFKYRDFSNNPELEDLRTPSFKPYKDNKREACPRLPDNDNEADPNTYNKYVGAIIVLQ